MRTKLWWRILTGRAQHIFCFSLIDDVYGVLSFDSGWLRVNENFIFQYRTMICPRPFSERYGHVKFLNLGIVRVRIGTTAGHY